MNTTFYFDLCKQDLHIWGVVFALFSYFFRFIYEIGLMNAQHSCESFSNDQLLMPRKAGILFSMQDKIVGLLSFNSQFPANTKRQDEQIQSISEIYDYTCTLFMFPRTRYDIKCLKFSLYFGHTVICIWVIIKIKK